MSVTFYFNDLSIGESGVLKSPTIIMRSSMCVLSFSKISFMDVCLSQGFYSCTNIMTKKQVREEKVYSAYTSILLFIIKEVRTGTETGKELEAGADGDVTEESCLLACFPWLGQPALL